MSHRRSIDWTWVAAVAGIAVSIGGLLYSFRFLVGALGLYAISLAAKPRSDKQHRGWVALEQVYAWEKHGGPRPSEETFRTAADWYMYNIDTLRKEDLDTYKGCSIPVGVRPYLKSERELPRQTGIIL